MRVCKSVFIGYVVSWVQGMRPGAFWLEGHRGSGLIDRRTEKERRSASREVLSEFRKPSIPTCLPPRDIPALS